MRSFTPCVLLHMVWAPPISLATTFGIDFSYFSSGYLDGSVPRVPSVTPILFSVRYHDVARGGFPHSDTCGSPGMCRSPQLFAACRVLLRRHMPRHPPCALRSLFVLMTLSSHLSLLSVFSLSYTYLVSEFRKFSDSRLPSFPISPLHCIARVRLTLFFQRYS